MLSCHIEERVGVFKEAEWTFLGKKHSLKVRGSEWSVQLLTDLSWSVWAGLISRAAGTGCRKNGMKLPKKGSVRRRFQKHQKKKKQIILKLKESSFSPEFTCLTALAAVETQVCRRDFWNLYQVWLEDQEAVLTTPKSYSIYFIVGPLFTFCVAMAELQLESTGTSMEMVYVVRMPPRSCQLLRYFIKYLRYCPRMYLMAHQHRAQPLSLLTSPPINNQLQDKIYFPMIYILMIHRKKIVKIVFLRHVIHVN